MHLISMRFPTLSPEAHPVITAPSICIFLPFGAVAYPINLIDTGRVPLADPSTGTQADIIITPFAIVPGNMIVFIFACFCSSTVRLPHSYDPMDLMNGIYSKKGNPATGLGYVNSGENGSHYAPGQFMEDDEFGPVIPLRSPEVIKKIVICPKGVGAIMIRRTEAYMVIKKPEWILE